MKTLSGTYQIQNANAMERICDDKKEAFNRLWLYPAKKISKDFAADGVQIGLLVPNDDTVFVGEITEGEKFTPDELDNDSGALLYELPQGESKLLRDVIIQGATVGDGVVFKYWPA